MLDYTLFNNEEGQPQLGPLKKTRAKIQSPGGVLSNNVRPGQGGMLPNAIDSYRSKAADLYKQGSDLYDTEPDFSQFQNFARQRSEQGEGAMLNALAAQFAGEGFAPVQQQYLKKAAAARDPMKMGSGIITAEGEFLKDPEVAQNKKAEFLLQQAKAYETLAANAQTREEQQQYRSQQDKFMNELRTYMAQTGRINATNAGAGGPQRAPAGYQWATAPDGQPALTFIPGGPADPQNKKQGEPTQDEKQSAGWAFRMDNALRLIDNITQKNPKANESKVIPSLTESVPLVGPYAARLMKPDDRIRVENAQLDALDAALTLSTGAAYTKEQLKILATSYFPQPGETDPQVLSDKKKRLADLVSVARIRGGRATGQMMPQDTAAPAANNNDPFGIRSK